MARIAMLRWVVASAVILVCVAFVKTLAGASAFQLTVAHHLALVGLTLVAYSWLLYPVAGSVTISVAVGSCLMWGWAARQTVTIGVDLLAFALLLGVAVVQRRRRFRHFLRLQQVVDDLREELTVKRQAVAHASQTHEALQKKLSRYQQLQTIAEELSGMTDAASVARLAVERAFGLIGKSDVCLLFLVDKERQELSLFASKRRESLASIRAKHGDQFDRYILRTHRPLLVNDVRRDFRFTVTVSPDRTVSSVIACPLLLGQSPEGVLRLDSAQTNAYTQDDLRFLDILLDLVSAALTNAQLFSQTQQLAMTDGLTGLMLRRPFLEQVTRELTRAGRTREPVSVLMLDIDHFKDYNDALGHMAGDLILKAIAEVVRVAVPPGTATARYGGEEFAVLLPRLPRHQAGEIAEKIRKLVEIQVQGSHRGLPRLSAAAAGRATTLEPGSGRQTATGAVTVSIGVATFPEDAQAELELIRVADRRLYHAKHAGRNLVISS